MTSPLGIFMIKMTKAFAIFRLACLIGVTMYEGVYRGRFSFVTPNADGTLTDELGINQYFGGGILEMMGAIVPHVGDYNKDGDIDFNIGKPPGDRSGEMKFALFSIKKAGYLYSITIVPSSPLRNYF